METKIFENIYSIRHGMDDPWDTFRDLASYENFLHLAELLLDHTVPQCK